MKTGFIRGPSLIRLPLLLIVVISVSFLTVSTATAATNQATGSIAGVDADLVNSNIFTLNSDTLALVKTAFLTDGTQLSPGANIPSGTVVGFMIYIDNSTGVPVSDIRVSDPLTGFTYVSSSIRVDNTLATGATEAAIWAAVEGNTALLDPVNSTDVGGESAGTVSLGLPGNLQLDIAAGNVWVVLFEATVD